MVILNDKKKQENAFANDEFEKYLTEQRTSTTFNGIEVSEFIWYKKLLGLKAF